MKGKIARRRPADEENLFADTDDAGNQDVVPEVVAAAAGAAAASDPGRGQTEESKVNKGARQMLIFKPRCEVHRPEEGRGLVRYRTGQPCGEFLAVGAGRVWRCRLVFAGVAVGVRCWGGCACAFVVSLPSPFLFL